MTDLSIFAMIAAGVALWGQIRGVFDRIRSLFIVRVTVHGSIAQSVSNYLWANGQVLRWGDRYIRSGSIWVRPLERVAEVAFENAPIQPMLCWIHGRPVMFSCPREGSPHGSTITPGNFEVLVLTSLRWCLNIEALTKEAINFARSRHTSGSGRYFVRRISGRREGNSQKQNISAGGQLPVSYDITPEMRFLHWSADDIGAPQPQSPFASLSLCAQGTAAAADFRRWLQLKNWYSERGIPWRRGHLFYGPPGTGKTSLARALAQESDMPVFAFDLSTLDNEQFSDAWRNMQEYTPCIALIEDIDGVFHGRKNILANDRRETLTFDCLLNALGGIQTADGVFVVITTNAPETLDSALCNPSEGTTTSRPGRIDRAYCLQSPAINQRRAILTRICGSADERAVNATSDMSAAQVTEYAINEALRDTWSAEPDAKL